jgi:hypothetical protein
MGESLLGNVRTFKYLGVQWTDKLPFASTVNYCLEKIQKSYIKLKWLKRNRHITTEVLRTCFFAFSFPFFAWLFPFFLMLPNTQQVVLKSKFRVGIRMIHRCLSTPATDLFTTVKERRLDEYLAAYLKKRFLNMHKSDLDESLFINNVFYWDALNNKRVGQGKENKKLHVGQFIRLQRVTKMLERHESYLIYWINFIENQSNQK